MVSRLGPDGIRLAMPDADKRPGRIFRDLGALGAVFDTKGSDASPELLRVDSGVLLSYDLRPVLARELATDDAVQVEAAPGAASTFASTAFSFASDHILKSVTFTASGATAANVDWLRLRVQPFGDPNSSDVWFSDSSAILAPAAMDALFPMLIGLDVVPLRMRRATDYIFGVRSNAGGSCTGRVRMLVELLEPGTGW